MGCCSSSQDDYQDEDDDVLVFPITAQRSQPRVAPRTSNFVVLEPSHLQAVTTSSVYLRPPATTTPRTARHTVSVVPDRRPPTSGRIVRRNCEVCGQSDHLRAECRYRNRLCFYCREEGHIISVCPNKRRRQNQGRGRGGGRRGQRRGV